MRRRGSRGCQVSSASATRWQTKGPREAVRSPRPRQLPRGRVDTRTDEPFLSCGSLPLSLFLRDCGTLVLRGTLCWVLSFSVLPYASAGNCHAHAADARLLLTLWGTLGEGPSQERNPGKGGGVPVPNHQFGHNILHLRRRPRQHPPTPAHRGRRGAAEAHLV